MKIGLMEILHILSPEEGTCPSIGLTGLKSEMPAATPQSTQFQPSLSKILEVAEPAYEPNQGSSFF